MQKQIVKRWSKQVPGAGRVDFTIIRCDMEPSVIKTLTQMTPIDPVMRTFWYNGYCTFREIASVPMPGYSELEGDVDVHGGLTYSGTGLPGKKDLGQTYGFDTAHYGDTDDPKNRCNDIDGYLTTQCEKMATQIVYLLSEEVNE